MNKNDLRPFTKVKAKNGKIGIFIIYEDSEIIIFENLAIFLDRYNEDLTLRTLNGMSFEGETDRIIKQYRLNLLMLKDNYYGYEIEEICKKENFNEIFRAINFDYLKSKDWKF